MKSQKSAAKAAKSQSKGLVEKSVKQESPPTCTSAVWKKLDEIVQRYKRSFFECGRALKQIKETRAYLHGEFTSWDSYTQSRCGWSGSRGYQLVRGYEFAEAAGKEYGVEIPTCEHAIVLSGVPTHIRAKLTTEKVKELVAMPTWQLKQEVALLRFPTAKFSPPMETPPKATETHDKPSLLQTEPHLAELEKKARIPTLMSDDEKAEKRAWDAEQKAFAGMPAAIHGKVNANMLRLLNFYRVTQDTADPDARVGKLVDVLVSESKPLINIKSTKQASALQHARAA